MHRIDTIKIETLENLNEDDLRRLNAGYTSQARYLVSKRESQERTLISLELTPLEAPYVKTWDTPDEDLARYREIIGQGLSLVARDGGQAVAIAIAEKREWNRSLWVWEFHVARTHQRKGIGRRLMGALAERARAGGMRTVVCETQNTNVPAIAFYRAVGFEIEAIDLSYYTNQDVESGEVAIFMKRKIEEAQ
ncbi:MAG: GNAT family N-acetyltransferase [Anaerolineales bacterium]|nr:GNAT family N-acetyltransferase [Anaerolineales bacterium]